MSAQKKQLSLVSSDNEACRADVTTSGKQEVDNLDYLGSFISKDLDYLFTVPTGFMVCLPLDNFRSVSIRNKLCNNVTLQWP